MPFFVKRGHLIVHSLLSYYQDYEEANKKYFAYYLTRVFKKGMTLGLPSPVLLTLSVKHLLLCSLPDHGFINCLSCQS